jgi:hypothetical protein
LSNFSKEISVEQNSFRNEIQKINNEIDEIINKKLDKKEYENFVNKILLDVEQKVF